MSIIKGKAYKKIKIRVLQGNKENPTSIGIGLPIKLLKEKILNIGDSYFLKMIDNSLLLVPTGLSEEPDHLGIIFMDDIKYKNIFYHDFPTFYSNGTSKLFLIFEKQIPFSEIDGKIRAWAKDFGIDNIEILQESEKVFFIKINDENIKPILIINKFADFLEKYPKLFGRRT